MKHTQVFNIGQADREKLIDQKAFVVWFTGLSGSGKTTIANKLETELHRLKYLTYILDGDRLRQTLHKELLYTPQDRLENIRRNGQIAKMLVDAGLITICAFMSGIEKGRQGVKSLFPAGEFVEVFLDCPLAICQRRDPKGLYKKARTGQIKDLLGFDIPYEQPNHPDIVLDTSRLLPKQSVKIIVQYLIKNKYLNRR
jgi:adenylylsulfate kinase